MIEPFETRRDDIVGFRMDGTISEVDIRPLLLHLNKKLRLHKKLRLLVEYVDTNGFSMDTLMEDFAYSFGHWGNFEKTAIITFKDWISQASQLAHELQETNLKSFSYSEKDMAIQWIEQ